MSVDEDMLYESLHESWDEIEELKAENEKLREQIERLVTLLRVDCDIDASWDGLRRFWNIGLTESGCLMRDRACKAEVENEKLREFARTACKIADSLCELAPSCAKCACPDTTDGRCVLTQIERSLYELGVEV